MNQETASDAVAVMGPPASRNDFEIAIVCALPREIDAVELVFDELWDDGVDKFGRAVGDDNVYTTGCISDINVVLALLPNMGKVAAAGTVAGLRVSFPGVKLVLLSGICGGVPSARALEGEEMLLGDVIVSTTIIQYDLGRQNLDDFVMRDTIEDSLGRGSKNIRNLVNTLKKARTREKMEKRAATYLIRIQEKQGEARRLPNKYKYPGTAADKLFPFDYHHKHHQNQPCDICLASDNHVCKTALGRTCGDLACDNQVLVLRHRLTANQALEAEGNISVAQEPSIFVGRIGSADAVIKNGVERDKIARRHDLVAFEMEGAGIIDELPCIVIKGVCDYADTHKNKDWQDFAAATAASVTRTLVEAYPKRDGQLGKSPSPVNAGSLPPLVTFNGPVTATNIVSGINHTGGTSYYNFN